MEVQSGEDRPHSEYEPSDHGSQQQLNKASGGDSGWELRVEAQGAEETRNSAIAIKDQAAEKQQDRPKDGIESVSFHE